jgi:hypothetical protein
MQSGRTTPRFNPPLQSSVPMRVSFNGDLLEVSAVLRAKTIEWPKGGRSFQLSPDGRGFFYWDAVRR